MRTPAQIYSAVFGVALLAAGIIGFFVSATFGSPGETGDLLAAFRVNGWHDLVHVASGVVGLSVASRPGAARIFAGGFGLVYLVVAIWGFALGSSGTILGFLPVNIGDDILHIAIAGLGLAAAAASHEHSTVGSRLSV
jgi:Domain of unknown function (DUF4383)